MKNNRLNRIIFEKQQVVGTTGRNKCSSKVKRKSSSVSMMKNNQISTRILIFVLLVKKWAPAQPAERILYIYI